MTTALTRQKPQEDGFSTFANSLSSCKDFKHVPKSYNIIYDWIKFANVDVPQGATHAYKFSKGLNAALTVPGIIGDVNKGKEGIKDLVVNRDFYSDKAKWKKGTDVAFNFIGAGGESAGIAKSLNDLNIVKMSASQLRVAGGVSNAGLAVGCIKSSVEDVIDIKKCHDTLNNSPTTKTKKEEMTRLGHNWASLIKNISYVALAAIGLASLASIALAPLWAVLSLVTVTVALGIFTTFYDKIAHYTKRPDTLV